MGTLHYGNGVHTVTMPDDILAHVKVVATTKLRRNESFTLSWRHPSAGDAGRSTLWMQPSIPLLFQFDSAEPARLDPDYLRSLADAANTSTGLVVSWEPETVPTPLHSVAA